MNTRSKGPANFSSPVYHACDKLEEPVIKWKSQPLGVRWPGSALVRLTYLAAMVECFAGAGQSGAGPPHSKELTFPLDQRLLKLIGHQGRLSESFPTRGIEGHGGTDD